MKETLNLEDFKTIMAGINNTIQENKIVLSRLDSINRRRGPRSHNSQGP